MFVDEFLEDTGKKISSSIVFLFLRSKTFFFTCSDGTGLNISNTELLKMNS